MRFTSAEAFEDSEAGDPIMLTPRECMAICREHDALFSAFLHDLLNGADLPRSIDLDTLRIDAAKLLAWLGY